MNYQESLEYLDRHVALGVKPGLERIGALLEAMGSPHEGYPIVHIAGTNGKTSTARMTTVLLAGHGLSTGTFTSPHLQRVEERLAMHGEYATPEEFSQALSDVAVFVDLLVEGGADPNTYFELTTAAAFAFFTEKTATAAVLEVGLGGRLDATNVVDAEVCVVTGIGVEHVEYLGDDVKTIAKEKLGIVGAGSILVTGDLPGPASEAAGEKVRELGIQHRIFGRDFGIGDARKGIRGWHVSIDGAEETYKDIFLPVHGRHQIHNLAVSIAAAEALVGHKLDNDAVAEAIVGLTLPGRLEPVSTAPLVMLDGAHNADGVSTLVAALEDEFPTTRWQVVLGVMGDKNIDLMVDGLGPIADGFVVTAPVSERAVKPLDLADRMAGKVDVPVLVAESTAIAVDMARAEAGQSGSVLVTGSLYLVGEARGLFADGNGP